MLIYLHFTKHLGLIHYCSEDDIMHFSSEATKISYAENTALKLFKKQNIILNHVSIIKCNNIKISESAAFDIHWITQ